MEKLLIVVALAVLTIWLITTKIPTVKGEYEIIVFSHENGTLDISIDQKHHDVNFTKGTNPAVYIEMIEYNVVHARVKLQGSNVTSDIALFAVITENKYNVELDGALMSLTTKLICAPGYGGSYCELGQGILTTTPTPDDRLDWESSSELADNDSTTINPNDTPTVDQEYDILEAQGNDTVESRSPALEQEPSSKLLKYTKYIVIVLSIFVGVVLILIIVDQAIMRIRAHCCKPPPDELNELIRRECERQVQLSHLMNLEGTDDVTRAIREHARYVFIYERLADVTQEQYDRYMERTNRAHGSTSD